jgi:hypothetical protein
MIGEVIVIDLCEERNWGICCMCDQYKRLDHAVAYYCEPTHDEIGSVSTQYTSTDGKPAIVGGMCVCKGCHDIHYQIDQTGQSAPGADS